MPGVRVLLHEHDIESVSAFPSEDFPEPDYEDFGRARILHVFLDQGGSEETTDVPFDWDQLPVLPYEPALPVF